MKAALARGDTCVIADEVDELLAAAGIKLDHGSASYRKLALAILKVDVEAYQAMAARQEGEPVATPPAPPSLNGVPPAAVPGPGDITVSALWERYVQERKPPPKTLYEFGLRVPTQSSRAFRWKPAGDSDAKQPPIPRQASRS